MIGLGLDAVEIERFRGAVQRHPRILERLFTERERADMSTRDDPIPGFAARFAVREAVMKALGLGIGDVRMSDIGVVRAESGAPSIALSGSAQRVALAKGVKQWHLSITHTDTVAMAVVAAI